MYLLRALCTLAAAFALAGCAHNMQIAPDVARIERLTDAKPKINARVAYFIDDALRKEEKSTPGGGGDQVTTLPYRDLEVGFYKMLSNVFENVTVVKGGLQPNSGHDYVVVPLVTPNSSSTSMLTWPPTHFSIDLACDISGPDGKLLFRKQVVGHGQAEFTSFKNDPGLAGKLAMEDALLKMQKALLDLPAPGVNSVLTSGR